MFVGFNPSNCFACLNELKLAYLELYNALNNQIQNLIFNPLSDKWACEQAVEFFQSAREVIGNTVNNYINPSFEKIVGTINNTSINFAISTKTDFSGIYFETNSSNLNIDNVKEVLDNKKGIDLISVRDSVKNGFETISVSIDNAINRAKNAIVTYKGFYGEFVIEQDAIYNLLDAILLKTGELITYLKNMINNAVKATVSQYGYMMFSVG